jgi:hypothetical protein
MIINALNKMAQSLTPKLSYAGQLIQTAHFSTTSSVVNANLETTDMFLRSCGGKTAAIETNAAWLWLNVSPENLIKNLLTNFDVGSDNWTLQKPELMKFIRSQVGVGELTNWTIALVNTRGDAGTFSMAGCAVGVTQRKPEDETWLGANPPSVFATSNANIQSPSHQALDLDLPIMTLNGHQLEDLLAKRDGLNGKPLFTTAEAAMLRECCQEQSTLGIAAKRLTSMRRPEGDTLKSKVPINGSVARQLRPKTHGLLLIYLIAPKGRIEWPETSPFVGLAFSFPSSETATTVEYRVNKIWDAMGGREDDDGDD